MDRLAAGLAAALVLSMLRPASAQSLATLHVRAFTMTADNASVRVGEPFHLTLSAHVDEAVSDLDNVTLPDLAGFDVYGDERRCVSSSRGTDCTETVTLRATVAGDRTIAPATLDAVDARNRKPSRFATNAVGLHVTGAGPPAGIPPALAALAYDALRAAMILLLLSVAALALLWAFGRRSPPRAAPQPVAQPPAPPDPNARLRALAETLEREPTRASAVALRAALRESVGAREHETLADLRARRAGGNGAQSLAALGAVERAAFCEEANVASAVREALPFLSR